MQKLQSLQHELFLDEIHQTLRMTCDMTHVRQAFRLDKQAAYPNHRTQSSLHQANDAVHQEVNTSPQTALEPGVSRSPCNTTGSGRISMMWRSISSRTPDIGKMFNTP